MLESEGFDAAMPQMQTMELIVDEEVEETIQLELNDQDPGNESMAQPDVVDDEAIELVPYVNPDEKVTELVQPELNDASADAYTGLEDAVEESYRRLSDEADYTEQNFYCYHILWAHLEKEGWLNKKATNDPLVNYYFIRKGKDIETGILGQDVFTSFEDVVSWAKEINYRKQFI